MDTRDLKLYRDWYGSLSKKEQGEYVKGLGSNKKYEVQAATVRGLAKKYLNKKITGCGFCLLSAHFELIKYDMANKKETAFALLAGVVLYDVVAKNFNKVMTAKNVTDDLALYHLSTNPECIKYFTKVPQDLEARLTEYKAQEAVAKVLGAQADEMAKKVDEAKKAYDAAQASADKLKGDWEALAAELKKMKEGKTPEAPKKEPKPKENPKPKESPKEAPKEPEKEGTLEVDIKDFKASGMTKEDVLASYQTEIESKMYTAEQIGEIYDKA